MPLLLTAALKGTLIVVAGLVMLRLLRGRSAATRHWVLAGALVAAAVIPLLQPVVPAVALPVPAVRNSPRAPFPDGAARGVAQPAMPGVRRADSEGRPVAVARAEPVEPLPVDRIVMTVWLAGAALSLGILAVGFVRLRWLTRRAVRVENGPWAEIAAAIAADYGIRRRIAIVETTHPSLLVTWGWLRPRIALPIGATRWPADRIRIVLAHELAHIRRADWLVQLGAELLRSIYWFNPLLWVACKRLRDESERACDDAVLEGGVDGPEYAWHLLHLARAFKGAPAPMFPAPAIARPSSLEQRIGAMLNPRLNRQPMTRRAAAATFAALVLVTLPIAALQNGRGSFEGRVLNPAGDAAANARIVLSQGVGAPAFERRTDAEGRFAFEDLPAGTYRLDIWRTGDMPDPMGGLNLELLGETLTLRAGEHVVRDLTFGLPTVAMSAVVAVNASGEPMAMRDRGFPPSWTCIDGVGMNAFCGPPSLLEEFERDLQERGSIPRNVQMPRLIQRVVPVYPSGLVGSGLEATVTVEGRLGVDGLMTGIRVIGGADPAFIASSRMVAEQLRWEPARVNAVPTEVPVRLDVEFRVRQ